jgi:RNA polymerase sigma-70 factor, ECF subfamily
MPPPTTGWSNPSRGWIAIPDPGAMCRGRAALHSRVMATTTRTTPRRSRRAAAVGVNMARRPDEITPGAGRGRSDEPDHAASHATDAVSAEGLLGDLEQHRRELTGYCSRMLGSIFEADDAAQETILRAWRGIARFDGRSSVRAWLYRIARNVCLDMLRHQQRRALPIGLGPSPATDAITHPMLRRRPLARPVRNPGAQSGSDDPADLAESRESVRLAFATALGHLPPRQVAVLILRDVLRWSAADVAQFLDTTVTSVNSAVQRARATLANPGTRPRRSGPSGTHRARLARYIDAFERSDVESLVALLREDAVRRTPAAVSS